MSSLYGGPSIDTSYQVSVHLAKKFQRRDFQKLTNQKQELPVAAMFVNGSGLNEQSLYRTFHSCFLPSFDSFGQAVPEEKISKNRPIRNKNCLWQSCLLIDQKEMSNLYRGPSNRCFLPSFISFGQTVSEEKLFQKSTNKKQKLPRKCMFVNG